MNINSTVSNNLYTTTKTPNCITTLHHTTSRHPTTPHQTTTLPHYSTPHHTPPHPISPHHTATSQQSCGMPDPVREVFDVPVKIADLGNACWTVGCGALCLLLFPVSIFVLFFVTFVFHVFVFIIPFVSFVVFVFFCVFPCYCLCFRSFLFFCTFLYIVVLTLLSQHSINNLHNNAITTQYPIQYISIYKIRSNLQNTHNTLRKTIIGGS